MEVTRSKKFPHFSDYVEHEVKGMVSRRRTAWSWPIAGVSFIFTTLAGGILARFTGPLTVPLMLSAWVAAMVVIDRKLKTPRTSEDRFMMELDGVIKQYTNSMNSRRLHRDIDYTAGQLLEASAYYWSKIRMQLHTPAWDSDSTPLHLRVVRQQTLQAIEEAMLEQLNLCARCLAVPGQKQSTDLRDIIEDALGIDVDKVLENIKSGVRTRSGFQSQKLPEIFEASRTLAERLKELSAEIDRMSMENFQRLQGTGLGASSSLDAALKSLQDIKIAQQELEGDQHLHERL